MFHLKETPYCAVVLAMLLAACTRPVGPQDSLIATPSAWGRLSGAAQAADLNAPLASGPEVEIDQAWWEHFDDPALDVLITDALANNKTLQIAKARVEEARASRRDARSRLLPQVDGAVGAQQGRVGYFTSAPDIRQDFGLAEGEVIATWELDLFGRNQARMAQAAAILQSEEATRLAVRVGLLAEVARNYFEMRNYERQIDLTKQNLATQKKTLELISEQKQASKASDLDVQRASAQVATTESLIPSLRTAHDASLNRLNVLLGCPPGSKDALLETPRDLKPLDQHILIAAPAKVLAARPDVRAAERRFAASISAKYVAQTGWLPDISLLGFFGSQTLNAKPLLTPFWSSLLGQSANVVLPMLNFEKILSQIDTADAQQKQAFLNYQKTVLEALENMEDALSSYLNETARNASLTDSVAANRKSVTLVRQKYGLGYASFLDVLDAERNLLIAESSQAASDAGLRNDLVGIYAAAGGGWSDLKSDETAQSGK